jgi:hypothetical protein
MSSKIIFRVVKSFANRGEKRSRMVPTACSEAAQGANKRCCILMLVAVDCLRLSEAPDSVSETAIQHLICRIKLTGLERSRWSEAGGEPPISSAVVLPDASPAS